MASNITENKSTSNSVADLLASAPNSITHLLKAHRPGHKDDEKLGPDVGDCCSTHRGEGGLDADADCCSIHGRGTKPAEEFYRRTSKTEISNPGAGQMSSSEEEEYPAAFRLAMIIMALALSIFLVALDMTIVATAIPRITDQFHSLDQVGWY